MTLPKFEINLAVKVIIFILAMLIIYRIAKKQGEDNPASKAASTGAALAAALPILG